MDELRSLAMKKLEEIGRYEKICKDRLRMAPAGSLNTTMVHGKRRFYHRDNGMKTYLSEKKGPLICDLAQKGYDEDVLQAAMEQKKALESMLRQYDPEKISQLYDKQSSFRKNLVTPVILTDEMYIQQWYEERNPRKNTKEFTQPIFTERGEQVRSKSEKIIADFYYAHHIPYVYEEAVYLKGRGWCFSDFTLLNVRERKTYRQEHLGMLGKEDYADGAIEKIQLYQANGYYQGVNILFTFESQNQVFDTRQLEGLMKQFLL